MDYNPLCCKSDGVGLSHKMLFPKIDDGCIFVNPGTNNNSLVGDGVCIQAFFQQIEIEFSYGKVFHTFLTSFLTDPVDPLSHGRLDRRVTAIEHHVYPLDQAVPGS